MSGADGTTRDLSQGRMQALQAILNSVSPEGTHAGGADGTTLTEGQIRRISSKLGEIFGEDPNVADDGTRRNEKGELVNEEGLPIIDISEPADPAAVTTQSSTATFDDPYVLPQWTLSPEEKARRKAEHERILDLLEKEERLEAEREENSERERFREDLERRKQAAGVEMDSLKRAKELQKKMGKALVRNVVESRDKKEQETARELQDAEAARTAEKPLKSKKSVTFAEEIADEDSTPDWGDVIPAQLDKGRMRRTNQPMKMDVVERLPAASLRSPPPRTSAPEPDSDDESVPETSPGDELDDLEALQSDGGESNGFLDDEDPQSDWDEDEFDSARHQREVALAYYEKRKTVSAQVASAMRSHSHEEGEHEWDQPEVPLDATLSSLPPKPPISRFKSTLPAPKTSTLPSHSLGPYIIPSSQSHVLSRAIKYGKLEDNQLVGGDAGESEDEQDGNLPTEEEILRMFSEGKVTNAGPSPRPSQQVPMAPSAARRSQPTTQPVPVRIPGSLSRTAATQFSPGSGESPISGQSTAYSPSSSSLSTPIAVTERSSPKMTTPVSASPVPDSSTTLPSRKPAISSFVKERSQLRDAIALAQPSPRSAPAISGIIESNEFGAPSSQAFRSDIIDSPSFATTETNAEVREGGPTNPAPAAVNGAKSTGRKKPDEYFQSLEVAHHFVFGYGHLTWEWVSPKPIRSVLYPALNIPIYWLLKIFRLDRTDLLIWVAGERYVPITYWLSIASFFNALSLSRSLSNSLEASLTTIALSYYPWHSSDSWRKDTRLSLVFAALACAVRPTNAVLWVHMFGMLLWRLCGDVPKLRSVLIDALSIGNITLGFIAALDSIYYGQRTFTPLNFLLTNLSSVSLFYGSNPWHYYVLQALPILCTTTLPFVLHGAWLFTKQQQAGASKVLLGLCAWTIAIYSIAGHKEWRFIHPLLPLLHIMAAKSVVDSSHRPQGEKKTTRSIRLSYVWLVSLQLPLIVYIVWFHARAQIDVMHYFRSLSSTEVKSAGFLMPCHSTPWQAYLHRPEWSDEGRYWSLGCEPPLTGENLADYKDQAAVFFSSPITYLQTRFPPQVDPTFPPSPKPFTVASHQERLHDWKHEWPQYIIAFGALLREPRVGDYFAAKGYGIVWEEEYGWDGDESRQGGVKVWKHGSP
ncbi:glycosylphosphatidylinositol anchor biosynthesis [Steccherinum ochraceum]|uniref:Mannosyltransferase n=1 Tax=Steccherinum ochraceum TaxID=92696 RepID=A0A4V2MWF3_9APHY|nr:glycosylphosphatidylinositol anchor biosynthesis [Steccherinum ochraceum]